MRTEVMNNEAGRKPNFKCIKEIILRVYMDFQIAHNDIYHDDCEPFPMVGRTTLEGDGKPNASALSLGFSLYHLIQVIIAWLIAWLIALVLPFNLTDGVWAAELDTVQQ